MKGNVSAVRLCQAENIPRNSAMNHDERSHVEKGWFKVVCHMSYSDVWRHKMSRYTHPLCPLETAVMFESLRSGEGDGARTGFDPNSCKV